MASCAKSVVSRTSMAPDANGESAAATSGSAVTGSRGSDASAGPKRPRRARTVRPGRFTFTRTSFGSQAWSFGISVSKPSR